MNDVPKTEGSVAQKGRGLHARVVQIRPGGGLMRP
jgi:hypothetical protein